jgi:serine/threonine protein kinase
MQLPLPAGTVLQNRYCLIEALGQGGFGRTYLAEDRGRFNERCALKEFIPPQADRYALEKARELFQREATILYQIDHPQIPKFQATFEDNGRLFLVQDYVQGSTYRALLDRRLGQGMTFGEGEVVYFLRLLLPVLGHLHGLGIVHRDISPENVMLRERDRLPVLIDFGVVKELATRFQVPDATVVQATTVGKTGYSPSEQIQTGRAYPSSDLYALAATAVVLLTGREPQDLFNDRELTWHWEAYVRLSPGLDGLLRRMLSYRPGDRYSSAAEVLRELGALGLEGQPTSSPVPLGLGNGPGVPGPGASGDSTATPTPTPASTPYPQPVSPRTAPNPSALRTVAVGRSAPDPERQPTIPVGAGPGAAGPGGGYRSRPDTPSDFEGRSSIWDNPWAVTAIGVLVVFGASIGSWAFVNQWLGSLGDVSAPGPIASPSPEVPEAPTASPSPSPSPTPSPSPNPTTVERRLGLRPGSPFEEVQTLGGNDTRIYRFTARPGQLLDAQITGAGVLMTVLDPNGRAVADGAQRTARWNGPLLMGGDYALEVRPSGGRSQANYRLFVSLGDAPRVPGPPGPIDGGTGNEIPLPMPVPTVQPQPSPAPVPVPRPSPVPAPVPVPQPSPVPVPEPVPSPEPVPTPQPAPEPEPEPGPPPEPIAPPPTEGETGGE